MAIEAHQLNYFLSHQYRDIMNKVEANTNFYNTQMDFGLPLSGITSESLLLPHFYNNNLVDSWLPETFENATTTMKTADSGVTYNNNLPTSVSRKRSRDSFSSNPLMELYGSRKQLCRNNNNNSVSFLGEDITLQIQQQQFEMDRFVSQHMEKVRLMMLQKRKEQSRRLVTAIDEKITQRLKEKQQEIEMAAKKNWLLEEKVKSLFLENQMWRNLAEQSEATANSLRGNIEQILSHQVKQQQEAVGADDAESCCGSSDEYDQGDKDTGSSSKSGSLCRKCCKEESCVVLLPCRHFCLCNSCEKSLHKCPICDSNKNGSVHVNLS
ncbi:RING-type E3 ubiquitin transferase [Ranunculus cassubicifolius]